MAQVVGSKNGLAEHIAEGQGRGTRSDEAAISEAWEQGRALTLDEAVALALDSIE